MIVFLAKCEANILMKDVSSKYFVSIITIIIPYNDFASTICVHTFIYLQKTGHFTLFYT